MEKITRNRRLGRFARATLFLVLLAAPRTGVAADKRDTNAFQAPGTWVNIKTIGGFVGVTDVQQQSAFESHVSDAPSSQRFWSMEKKIDVSIFAMQLTADAITTQRGLSTGFREVNPVLRPLVKRGVAGQTAATVWSFGSGLGAVYLLHATHHYRAERITLRLILAGEGALVGHNIALLH